MVKFQKNVLLKNYTTFRIGGRARYFFVAKTKLSLVKVIKAAKKIKLPFFILGGGSNLLVSDKGFNGLVIKTLNTKYRILNSKIMAEAGVILGQLVIEAGKTGLGGLEWASGIPGTLGGAVYGNAGTKTEDMRKVIKEVEVLDVKSLKIKKIKNKDCKFGYRKSIFKKKKNLIVLQATLELKKGNKEEIRKRTNEFVLRRKATQPLEFPSAGSIFKNPKGFFAGRPKERASPSAGELIERCGLKGKRIGDVKVSEKHANFIVNLGNGKSKDVLKLIKLIKQKVRNKFGIELEEEIQYLGFATRY